jgi:hypothetical protein
VHDQHQKQVCRFAGAEGGGEVGFDAVFFHATKRRVGHDHSPPGLWAPTDEGAGQGVVMADLVGHLDAVQDHVGGASKCGSGFFSTPWMLACRARFIVGRFHILLALVLDGAGQEAARAAGRVHHLFTQRG